MLCCIRKSLLLFAYWHRFIFAGKNLVSEQTIEIQEINETRRGYHWYKHPSQWPRTLRRFSIHDTSMECFVHYENVGGHHGFLHSRLHMVSYCSRHYAAAAADVITNREHRPAPPRSHGLSKSGEPGPTAAPHPMPSEAKHRCNAELVSSGDWLLFKPNNADSKVRERTEEISPMELSLKNINKL